MRVMLKGVHTVKKRLADGTERIYHYAWRGGPRLQGAPGSPEFIAAFNAATARTIDPEIATVGELIDHFACGKTPEWRKLSPRTKADLDHAFRLARPKFGKMRLIAVNAHGARAEFKKWRDGISSDRTADKAWAGLRRLFNYAIDNEWIARNPCRAGGRRYRGSRADIIWTDADVQRFLAAAPAHMRTPFLIALWTGQRLGDILRLTWSAYDGRRIRLKQSKTGRNVSPLVAGELKRHLDALREGIGDADLTAIHIVTNAHGRPWASTRSFGKSFARARAAAGLSGLTFHDLRGTAVTRMAMQPGTTTIKIASITGHSLKEVETILERHYLAAVQEMGDSVILRMNRERKL